MDFFTEAAADLKPLRWHRGVVGEESEEINNKGLEKDRTDHTAGLNLLDLFAHLGAAEQAVNTLTHCLIQLVKLLWLTCKQTVAYLHTYPILAFIRNYFLSTW